MASSLRPGWLQSPRPRRTQQTGRARRLHDVNKHSSILPSKRSSHCCGQRCLACVMSDEMAGNVLAVFDAHWCFSWPLRGLGKGVCVQPHCWTSIDQSQASKQFGDAVSEGFSFQNNGEAAIYLRDFKVVLGLLWYTEQMFLLISCWNLRTGALTELSGITNDQWTERYIHLDLESRRETIRETQTLFCSIEALKTRFMFHALGLQATIQRAPIVSNFSFALLQSSLCATGDHHIKTPLFMFPPPETASSPFCPVSSKDVSSFYMIGLDLQESPTPVQLFCSEGEIWGEWWGVNMGDKGRRHRGSWEQLSEGEMSRGLLLILAPAMLTIKMCVCVCVYLCVCVYVWERDPESEKKNWGLNISTQSSQQRHFHSRWSGSAAIWRPWWPDNLHYLQTQNFV